MPRKKITPTESKISSGDFANPLAAIEKPSRTEAQSAPAVRKGNSKGASTKAAARTQPAMAANPPSEGILEFAVSENEQIALLAYSYWEARGRQGGSPEDDWYRAEREFRKTREQATR